MDKMARRDLRVQQGPMAATVRWDSRGRSWRCRGLYAGQRGGPNQVAAYVRPSDGNLSRKGRFETAGMGLGAGVGSQGSLVFDAKSQRFFAVNAGDNTISMLAIDADGNLSMLSKMASGGIRPVSVAVHGNMVYVGNQGDLTATAVNANISGFQIQGNELVAVANSMRPLSETTDVQPTDIAFTPDGTFLVVAERLASRFDTFAGVNGVGLAGNFQASAGMQPFAFGWSPECFLGGRRGRHGRRGRLVDELVRALAGRHASGLRDPCRRALVGLAPRRAAATAVGLAAR